MARKGHRFWNVIIIITVLICLSVFAAHFKNYIKYGQNEVKILSGFYYKEIKYNELDSVLMVERIPPMVRLNGFSAFEKEKGLFREFKDSLTDKKIYVYVDNIENHKIKLVYQDSSKLYVNHGDSLRTHQLFNFLNSKIEVSE